MAGNLLPDDLREVIEHLFPKFEVSPEGGQRPIPNHTVLTTILFVFKTGIAWEDLPQELSCSYKTCTRRLAKWTEQGIWKRMHELFLA